MIGTRLGLAVVLLSGILFAQEQETTPQNSARSFPGPDFVLHDEDAGPHANTQDPSVVFGPIESDGHGGAQGSGATYGGSVSVNGGADMVLVTSLSLSGDGKILAVASLPGHIDIWDVENRKKLRTLDGGSEVALSFDGNLLADDSNGIELYDVTSGQLIKEISWAPTESGDKIEGFLFSPDGTLLDVRGNGVDDKIYEVSTGRLLATLTGTQKAQFSQDGSLLIGADYRHLVVWTTKNWKKVRGLPNGPDYVTAIAANPQENLVVIGGPHSARLLRLSTGKEIAEVDLGFINFAAFSRTGRLLLTDGENGFAVWDVSGAQYCSRARLGNGVTALSANDRWLASAPQGGGTAVAIWNVQTALDACGVPASARDH
jgi:WD40 repeat protein